ncbi:MAG: 4-hydroxy-tetrahydrodipicolinate reductase [Myxococcales bacterium]
MIRVAVLGIAGRMGGTVAKAVRAEPELRLAAATERPYSLYIGRDAGVVAGIGEAGVPVSPAVDEALARGVDVAIDFTSAAASVEHARACARARVAFVVGTTGFSPAQKADLAECAQQIPLVLSPNMSVGVNVLFRLVAEAARALGPAYDVEIVEMHHRAKKDAPSGTALKLAEAAAGGLDLDLQKAGVYSRHGDTGERRAGTIGIQALRGGDVVGDHTVYFLADGERIELTHRATSRDNFARGAIRAAKFVVGKPAGLYDLQDVLGGARR